MVHSRTGSDSNHTSLPDSRLGVGGRWCLEGVGVWKEMLRAGGEGNGNLLQYSCLENPRDRGVW